MDCLNRSLFDEFNDDSPKKAKVQRPCTPPVIKSSRTRPMPFITESKDYNKESLFSLSDDFNSSGEMISPPCSPTKLMSPSPNRLMQSPPSIHRGFLALKLFDTPHTPKTLLSKFKDAANDNTLTADRNLNNNIEQNGNLRTNKRFSSKSRERFTNLLEDDFKRPSTEPRLDRKHVVYANINPFTPSPSVVKHKRTRQEFERFVAI